MVRALLAVLVLALGVGFAHDARAQTKKWNQQDAAKVAGELESAISGLRLKVRASPNVDNPQLRRPMFEILDLLRQIEFNTTSLHAQLQKGAGMEETLPTYNRLQQLRREAEVKAQRVDVSAITRPSLDKARELLAQLEPYYPEQPQIQDLR